MRPPVDTILAPPVPRQLRRLRPPGDTEATPSGPVTAMVVCFWDVCQPSSIRTLDYLVAWHERYARAGLSVCAVHAPGSDAGRDEDAVAAAVTTLRLPFEILLDTAFDLWRAYENPGWPARYVLASGMRLVDVHFGEGDYTGAELAIQELLGERRSLLEPLRAAERPDALIAAPTPDQPGAYHGPYEAGEVWVVGGPGAVVVNGARQALDRIGAHRVIAHETHTAAVLELVAEPGTEVSATAFAPGLAPDQ